MKILASTIIFVICMTVAVSAFSGEREETDGSPGIETKEQEETIIETKEPEVILTTAAEEEPEERSENDIKKRKLDPEDKEVLKRMAMAEAEGEGTAGKALVMMVILNRTMDEEFPNSVKDVAFQKVGEHYQFSTVISGGRYFTTEPDAECEEAISMIENGWDESEGALYFENCPGESWQSRNCEFLFKYGNHKFYR